jgi:hypothetical protein
MGVAIDHSGNYIVTEQNPDVLSKITPDGTRTVVYTFASLTLLGGVATDSWGNYVVAEQGFDVISLITPGTPSTRTVLYTFGTGATPFGVAVVPPPSSAIIITNTATASTAISTSIVVTTETVAISAGWSQQTLYIAAAIVAIAVIVAVFSLMRRRGVQPTPVPSAPPLANVKYCIECGAPLKMSAAFCHKCGIKQ